MEPLQKLDGVVYAPPEEARRCLAAGVWRPETIGELIENAAAENGSALAIADEETRLDYAALERRTAAAARGLLGAGLTPGDRVLMQVGIDCAAAVTLIGAMRAGLVPVCAVPYYRAYEMGALADLSEARAHVVAPGAAGSFDLLELGEQLRRDHRSLELLLVAGEEGNGEAPALERPDDGTEMPPAAICPADLAAFQLSGGTTGVPKIIPRFHAEYLGYAAAWGDRLELTSDDNLLWALPVAHNAGMICFLLPSLLSGATLFLQRRFEAESFLGTIEREAVTVTGSIGPIAPRLLELDEALPRDLSSMRLFVTLNRAAEIERHLGVRAMNIYGITEGMLAASAPAGPPYARHRTVGRPASPADELAILAPGEEREVEIGEIGELCFRGPSLLRAYYRDPAATAAAFTASGFFRTGDLVRAHELDDGLHFSFEGRLKDNIDRGGEKFGTEEIELLLADHPAVREARVVGMPDPHLGERVCAFVVPAGEETPGVEELGEFLLARGLAKFKLPERVEVIAEMPVTAVGKLDRPALRAQIASLLEASNGHRRPFVAIVYHSGYGHTAAQARAACEGALEVEGIDSEMVFAEDAAEDPGLLERADAIILGCPTYMGSASAGFKQFIDATSAIWLEQGWKDRLAAGFTNSGGRSGDKLNTLIQLMLFAMQHGMVWVGLGLPDGHNSSSSSDANLNRLGAYAGAMAQSNVDQGLDGMFDSDLETARSLGQRVALATLRWDAQRVATTVRARAIA